MRGFADRSASYDIASIFDIFERGTRESRGATIMALQEGRESVS